MSWGWLLRVRESDWKAGEQEAVVWVRRSSWERVTEREALVGRLRTGSRLPQYLGRRLASVFVGGWSCKPNTLDHRDVDGGEGARSVHVVGGHCGMISVSWSVGGEERRSGRSGRARGAQDKGSHICRFPMIRRLSFLIRSTQGRACMMPSPAEPHGQSSILLLHKVSVDFISSCT